MAIIGKDYDRFESLQELLNSIDIGLDLEFNLYGKQYNISTDGTPFIALCPDGEGMYYKDAEDMLENHMIEGKPLKDIWQDFEILFM